MAGLGGKIVWTVTYSYRPHLLVAGRQLALQVFRHLPLTRWGKVSWHHLFDILYNFYVQVTLQNVNRPSSTGHTVHSLIRMSSWNVPRNRPFAQLLPGLETGHPVTVGQSPAYDFSVSDQQKAVFLVSVSDCSVCDSCAGAIHVQDWPTVTGCPVSNPGNNCANAIMFSWRRYCKCDGLPVKRNIRKNVV